MFLYVFSKNDALRLEGMGLTLINNDYVNNIYVFERPSDDFEINCPHVFSNTMSFDL